MSVGIDAEVVFAAEAVLGEGPLWDLRRHQLLWVDIPERKLHRLDPTNRSESVIDVGLVCGAAVPSRRGGLVLAAADGFWRLEDDGSKQRIAAVEADNAGSRINDAKCDVLGRFWAGTISLDLRPGDGSLYCLDTDGSVHRLLTGMTVPNGLAFSPDRSELYFIDSFAYGVDAYPVDLDGPTLGPARRVVDIPEAEGLCDGMTVDEEGGLWVAMFGGSCVRQFSPEGKEGLMVRVPVTHPTSCAFGGDRLDTLYITSARSNANGPMSPGELAGQPLAGAVFACQPGVRGLPADRCAL